MKIRIWCAENRSIKPKIRWKAKGLPDVWQGQHQALEVLQALILFPQYRERRPSGRRFLFAMAGAGRSGFLCFSGSFSGCCAASGFLCLCFFFRKIFSFSFSISVPVSISISVSIPLAVSISISISVKFYKILKKLYKSMQTRTWRAAMSVSLWFPDAIFRTPPPGP